MDNLKNIENGIPSFNRKFFSGSEDFMLIGEGRIGGKARGLAFIRNTLSNDFAPEEFPGFDVGIPKLAVLCTDVFDAFMKNNNLYDIALSEKPDKIIVHEFLKGDFPAEYVGDLMALMTEVNQPLAVRSSSLLEDALNQPFAGVYATKMIPNNQFDPAIRFQKLVQAIKFVYASTFFEEAKSYVRGANIDVSREKMAVIIQEVVGKRFGNRFYPTISGVGKSFNFYPSGRSNPEDGVINLALGLGRAIVDGGLIWSYSPVYPKAVPPFGSVRDMMRLTQTGFYAVNMGETIFDPEKETEFEVTCSLSDAEYDGNLKYIASTYNARSDRVYPGIGSDGPRIINFAPILVDRLLPINDLIARIMNISREAVETEVEIEFAMSLDSKTGTPVRFGFLQVRSMAGLHEEVEIPESQYRDENVIVSSQKVLGNGIIDDIRDIIYVNPDNFNAGKTPSIARELEMLNRKLNNAGLHYILIGFGRWGSSDPWLGTPVNWGQISGARVIVEAALSSMNVDMSQGSHFFHNLTGFGVPYFSIEYESRNSIINWEWLKQQESSEDTANLHHLRLETPLIVKVDGRIGKGVIYHG